MPSSCPSVLLVGAMPPMTAKTLGGNHRYLELLVTALAEAPIHLHLISDATPDYAAFLKRMANLGVSLHTAPFCTDPIRSAEALDETIRSIEPTLIHVNGHQSWLSPALLRSKLFGKARRRIYTMHLPAAAVTALRNPSWRRFIPGSWAHDAIRSDRAFLRRFDHVLSVSTEYGQALVAGGLIEPDRLTCLSNAVDTNVFSPGETSRSEGVIIGGAGNLIPQKRFDLLIEAFRNVHEALPACRLLVAGEGEQKAGLMEQARTLGLEDSVSFVGFQHDMVSFYRGIDIFALSSDHEAAPYVVLEAAACGTPVVSTAVGDLEHWFTHGVDALIAPVGDVGALGSNILELAGDEERRRTMGRRARRVVEEGHSNRTWALKIKEFFAAQIQNARASC